ncbi:MAG: N-acetyltransferase [Coriobacteriales bacterium]|jgi:putative acetyltransferase|nr:N-acetyltransferase [Coriobacteriales bacterium]
MNIRQETEADFNAVCALIKAAFDTAADSEGNEQDYVDRIRAGGTYIPELALVAEQDGVIIGHVMLAGTTVDDGEQLHNHLVLAILSVAEAHRRLGVGAALLYVALDRARRRGRKAVFLAGDRHYYSRFGFVPVSRFDIRHKKELPAEMLDNIMARELELGALDDISGMVEFEL